MAASPDLAPRPPSHAINWQPLPVRGARLAALGGALFTATTLLIVTGILLLAIHPGRGLQALTGIGLLGLLAGGWVGVRRHQATQWRLDEDSLGLRRGHWWHTETRIPLSRVQHLDLKRGPLERSAGLTTLVVHTAGTKLNTVTITGLDQHDAERLRDRLAHQLDHHDDAL